MEPLDPAAWSLVICVRAVSKPRLWETKFFNIDLKGRGRKELKRNETGLSLRVNFWGTEAVKKL